ncbi:hypothetical protein K505DRAFT_200301, partial [Melanomma pulvis-pyrius CBS 109.77]
LAAIAACQSETSSPPFRLVIESSNSTLNGTVLGACHEGAAIEGLCSTSILVTDDPVPATTFHYNVSSSANNDTDTQGSLHYTLVTANFNVTSTMGFSFDPSSNLAIPIISPGGNSATFVSFDSCGALYISDGIDDTTDPPGRDYPGKKLENWYICTTYWSYTYTTLAWKVGTPDVPPQNPTCQKVRVKRVFN